MNGARPAAAALSLLSLGLGGCTGLFRSTAVPEQIYYLRAPAVTAAGAVDGAAGDNATTPLHPLGVSLRVSHPLAAPGLDSPHIMLVQADHRMNFYAGSRWPGAAPDVLESLAAETLRASGAWTSVEDTASPFPSDYLLQLLVRRFEADYTEGGGAPVVHVVLECIMGRGEGREVVATFSASGSAPAGANRLHEVVAAFEQASGAALAALAQDAAQAARADVQRRLQNADSSVPSIRRPGQ
jgi:cholesterol transport system auxiliary component